MAVNGAAPVPFELGLVMAGAVSAGAYTAGVLDFLLQALETWETAKKARHPQAPSHAVRIKAISGASAGGINAALLATLATHRHFPVTQIPPPPGGANKLYRTWVEQIDLRALLQSRDRSDPSVPLQSLFDSTVLDEIASEALSSQSALKYRPYFDRHLHLLLSLTNLRGVPYSIRFSGNSEGAGHDLSQHADYLHFTVGNPGSAPPGALALDPLDLDSPPWKLLRQAALATSAFPGGLAPRLLHRRASDYAQRRWWTPLAENHPGRRCYEAADVLPHWPPQWSPAEAEYDFLCVDGGVMNNEPLELVRRVLAGDDPHNPREGERAKRAVLMIDPFAEPMPFETDYSSPPGLPHVLLSVLDALLNQARFKPEELALAWQEGVYSRFLIAPKRRDHRGPLASSALYAFGGFLDERLRQHDFQLGRRNCQGFLLRHFALPPANPLFAQWRDDPDLRSLYQYLDSDGEAVLPILPLVTPELRAEIPMPEWPQLSRADLAALRPALAARADAVLDALLPRDNLGLRWGAQFLWWLKFKKLLLDHIMSKVATDLRKNGLLPAD